MRDVNASSNPLWEALFRIPGSGRSMTIVAAVSTSSVITAIPQAETAGMPAGPTATAIAAWGCGAPHIFSLKG